MHPFIGQFESYLFTEKCLSKNSVAAYCFDVKQFLICVNKKDSPASVIEEDVITFLKFLKAKNIGARSSARKISSLKAFYSWAHERHGIVNFAADIEMPRIEKKLPHYLSEEQIEALFEASQKDQSAIAIRNSVMLSLLYVSGMRISELTELHVSDLNFETNFVTVRGKGGKERMVPLPEEMKDALKKYLNSVHKNMESKLKQSINYLFPVVYANKVKPITRQSFWIILQKLCRLAAIPVLASPHKLRHSLATHLLKKGANLRLLQMLLGHEQLSTVEIYTHVETTHLRKIYDKKHPRA